MDINDMCMIRECYGKIYESLGYNLTNFTRSTTTIKNQKQSSKEIKYKVAEDNVTVKGGYIKDPLVGNHKNVTVLDMDAMYPSIIIAFNLGPLTTFSECPENEKEYHKIRLNANTYAYSKKYPQGPLAETQSLLLNHRFTTKDLSEKKILKKISNSAYGFAARDETLFGGKLVAAAITQYARHIMKCLENEASRMGYTVLYIDTDSLFLSGKPISSDLPETLIARTFPNDLQPYFRLKVENKFNVYTQLKRKQYTGQYQNDLKHLITIKKGNYSVKKINVNTIKFDTDFSKRVSDLCVANLNDKFFNIFRDIR
ncbi:DNA polymerase-like protein, partial [Leptotrombidium deliense]